MDLATRVKTRREQLGLTQDELAKRMGYKSRVSINKIENGRPVSQKIIVRLAEALGTTPPYLMGWTNDVEEESIVAKPTTKQDDGLTESQRKLIEFAKTVPEDRAAWILSVMKKILEDD